MADARSGVMSTWKRISTQPITTRTAMVTTNFVMVLQRGDGSWSVVMVYASCLREFHWTNSTCTGTEKQKRGRTDFQRARATSQMNRSTGVGDRHYRRDARPDPPGGRP